MKLPKFIPSIKPRFTSGSSSPPSSPPKSSPLPRRLLSSPNSVLSFNSSSRPLESFPERKKGCAQVSVSSPLSKSEHASEITEEIPEEPSEPKSERCVASSGMVSAELVRELELVFQQFDANGDGKISATELGAVLRSLGDDTSDADAVLMVKEVDADGDGFIDLQEFIDLNTKSVDATGEIASLDELKSVFLIFDIDKDGFINAEELHTVLRSLGDDKCTVDDCGRMIKGVDRNGDGFVDFEEFKTMMACSFSLYERAGPV
eukprot:c26694_g1_i2 orf=463-1248(-)